MKIVCPNCDNENEFDLTAKIACVNCKEDISKHTYKKTILSLSGLAILTIGIVGGEFIDYVVTDNRYPLNVEYAIINSCVNSDSAYISKEKYIKKTKLCLCVLKDSMNEISYIRYKFNKSDFLEAFNENVEGCRE